MVLLSKVVTKLKILVIQPNAQCREEISMCKH